MKNCLNCYTPLKEGEIDSHALCRKKFFGNIVFPELPYHENTLIELAKPVADLQPRLLLSLNKKESKQKKFNLVDEGGEFILKIPTHEFQQLAEIEDLTMHLATIANIKVVPHCLIPFSSDKFAYIAKRANKLNLEDIKVEDMCQKMNFSEDERYNGTYEMVLDYIRIHSVNPGLDVVNFFEILLFSFLVGNSDMHLKKISFYSQAGIGLMLSLGSDLTSKALISPSFEEDFALTFNGKKKKIKLSDFAMVATAAKLDKKQQENILNKMINAKANWLEFIDISFLSLDYKSAYKELINNRFSRLLKHTK